MDLPNLAFTTGDDWSILATSDPAEPWVARMVDRHLLSHEDEPDAAERLTEYFTSIAPLLMQPGALGALVYAPIASGGVVKTTGHLYPVPPSACPPDDYERMMAALGPAGAQLQSAIDIAIGASEAGPFVRASARRTGAATGSPPVAPVYDVSVFAWWFPDFEVTMMLVFATGDLAAAVQHSDALEAVAATATRRPTAGKPAPPSVLPAGVGQ